jgi:3-oxoacyl-[acyl-carrier protein] reductase
MTQSVLITGASRGIGRAIALDLAKAGYKVVATYQHQLEKAEALATHIHTIGGSCRILQLDIADRAACQQRLSQDIAAHGTYYGIVCNAGIARDNAFPALTEEDWDSVLHTNLDGFFNVVHPLTMPMIQARRAGRIVVLSSVSGMIGNRGQVNYSAAKAGLIGAAKALAVELAKRNITVNCVAPGLIDTEMIEAVALEEALRMIPMQRTGKPEEVAAVVRFLLSPDAAYITRQVIAVNGGLI